MKLESSFFTDSKLKNYDPFFGTKNCFILLFETKYQKQLILSNEIKDKLKCSEIGIKILKA